MVEAILLFRDAKRRADDERFSTLCSMMKGLVEILAVSLGITTICVLWIVSPLVDPSHDAIYHWSASSSLIFLPVISIFLGGWFLTALYLLVAQRSERLRPYLWASIALMLPWFAFRDAIVIYGIALPHWAIRFFLASSLLAVLVLLTRWQRFLQVAFVRFQPLMITLLCFVAAVGVSMMGQLVWFARQAHGVNSDLSVGHVRHSVASNSRRTRIVWILFDELSYRQVYERRFPGLRLPAFDELAAQSAVFTHVIPLGIRTAKVVPGLITGQVVDDVRSSAAGLLLLHTPSGSWETFNQHQTVFQDALDHGYHTGIAGWYNPYCRLLPSVLDSCFWIYTLPVVNHMDSSSSVMENLRAPFVSKDQGAGHVKDFIALSQAARNMLEDRSLDFVMLHLPIPHPYGIYNRNTGDLVTRPTSYIDNLALTDRCLAEIRQTLEGEDEWDSSTIVVMGDHSWRTQLLWRNDDHWSHEDELANQSDRFDDRPAYIVKLPHQKHTVPVDAPFEAVRTRRLLDAVMQNEITSPEALSSWVR